MSASDDRAFMARAVRLSRRGFPAPNPHVGCVLVRSAEIVGEGWHDFAGGPHAEAVALQRAGDHARGATAYVTLEPCAHHGRTPPCADALIRAGVARVVIACLDPNRVAQGGATWLREAGIEVETGLMAEEAMAANRRFLEAMRLGRPYVVVKAAMSLDGRIALPSGESKWISGERARREAHRLRAEMGVVVVGRRTVEIDDPRLDARIRGVVNQPISVVLDPRGVLTGREQALRINPQSFRVTSQTVPMKDGRLDLGELLVLLANRGVTGVLVEGGGQTIAGFVGAGLVDAYELFLSPRLLGTGPTWLEGLKLGSIKAAPRVEITRVRRLDDDLWVSARPPAETKHPGTGNVQ